MEPNLDEKYTYNGTIDLRHKFIYAVQCTLYIKQHVANYIRNIVCFNLDNYNILLLQYIF